MTAADATAHTAEPWKFFETPFGVVVTGEPDGDADDEGRPIDRTHYIADMRDNGMDFADAARIVACVNAMAGVADPAAELSRLRADAEGLAEALNRIVVQVTPLVGQGEDYIWRTAADIRATANAAISLHGRRA